MLTHIGSNCHSILAFILRQCLNHSSSSVSDFLPRTIAVKSQKAEFDVPSQLSMYSSSTYKELNNHEGLQMALNQTNVSQVRIALYGTLKMRLFQRFPSWAKR